MPPRQVALPDHCEAAVLLEIAAERHRIHREFSDAWLKHFERQRERDDVVIVKAG
jgi:ribonuclease P protein component